MPRPDHPAERRRTWEIHIDIRLQHLKIALVVLSGFLLGILLGLLSTAMIVYVMPEQMVANGLAERRQRWEALFNVGERCDAKVCAFSVCSSMRHRRVLCVSRAVWELLWGANGEDREARGASFSGTMRWRRRLSCVCARPTCFLGRGGGTTRRARESS